MFTQLITTISLLFIGFDQAAEGLYEGSDVDFFSLKGSTLRTILSFLSVNEPRTSHEYNLCILAMLTMSRKDVKHVNWPRLEVLTSVFVNGRPVGEATLSCGFPMTL